MPVFRSDDKNILFVHVPKTGGSTIERVFANSGYRTLYRDPKEGPRSANWFRRCSPQHMHAAMLDQLLNISRLDLIFMLVREPLARFRSEYSMRNAPALRTDAESVEEWTDQAFRSYAENGFVFDNHLRPQWEFYLPGCVVYRLEDGIQSAVADLNHRFNLRLDEAVPRVMDRKAASGVASSEVVLTPMVEKRLREFYSEDIRRFGY
jgi:hypothetical protein